MFCKKIIFTLANYNSFLCCFYFSLLFYNTLTHMFLFVARLCMCVSLCVCVCIHIYYVFFIRASNAGTNVADQVKCLPAIIRLTLTVRFIHTFIITLCCLKLNNFITVSPIIINCSINKIQSFSKWFYLYRMTDDVAANLFFMGSRKDFIDLFINLIFHNDT